MKNTKLKLIAHGAAALTALLLASPPIQAQTNLVDEDWQGQDVAANLRLDDTTTNYPGWQFTQGNGNIFRSVDTPANGLPGGADGVANQAVQFEWDGQNAEYDTGYNWAASDVYTLSFNATEMNWSNASERAITVQLTETVRDGGGNLTGTLLWSDAVSLPQYDTAHNDAGEDWSAAQTFTISFTAGDFTGGTEGSALTFEVGGGGIGGTNRGTYVDNIKLIANPPEDNEAPTPSQMTFATPPAADGENSITMTATAASDASGVEYYFTETSGNPGGDDSGWQDSTTYTDTGLSPGTQYTYTVIARDKSPNQNPNTVSAPASATTDAADMDPPTPTIMTFATPPAADGETSISMTATTASDPNGVEYYFAETSGNPGGDDSGWQDGTSYTDTGLTGGTEYTYTVTARDKSPGQNVGTASAPASATTDAADMTAPGPNPMTFATPPTADGGKSISMTATTATDDNYGVEYYFTETSGNPGGADSGWQDSPTYTNVGLNGGTQYTYTVKARDKSPSQNETSESDPASATTEVVPAGILVDEDWQGNDVPANQRLDDTTTFYPGWQFTQGNGNIFRSVDTPANGLPGGADGVANQAVQFEWDGQNAEYDTGHNWAASDVYTLSFNATEMNWGNANERAITVQLTETVRDGGGNLTGTLLWSDVVSLPQYDDAHNDAGEDWSAAQTFTLNFSAGDFSGGTEGSELTFEIGGGGPGAGRGTYVDNILLKLDLPPEKFQLIITPNATTPGNYDFSWASLDGKVYDLVSSTDLSTPPETWPVWEGNMNIVGTAPTNTLDDVLGSADPDRFFAVVEKDPPPMTLWEEDFDSTTPGSLPADWTTGTNPADNSSLTAWELGTPANVGPVPPGVPLPSGANCVATNINGNYDDPVSDLGVAHTDIWLRTPAIDLGASVSATLRFQQWTQIEDVPGDLDYGSIRILDASDNSVLAVMESQSIDGNTSGWEEYTMALPAAAFTATAGTIKIEWQFEGDDIDSFAGWYIDDVSVGTP